MSELPSSAAPATGGLNGHLQGDIPPAPRSARPTPAQGWELVSGNTTTWPEGSASSGFTHISVHLVHAQAGRSEQSSVPVEVPVRKMKEATMQEQRGLRGLREVMLPAPVTPTPKQQVAIVLARRREPLLAREAQERMLLHFPGELVPTVAEVRTMLQEGSEFVQPERYRWQFGRTAGAWRRTRAHPAAMCWCNLSR